MLKNIHLISSNTIKEIIRDKVFYGLLGFALIYLISIFFISSLSLGQDIRVVKDLGLAGIYLYSTIISIYYGATALSREFERKTYLMVISRPVSTLELVLGKFLGLFTIILANIFLVNILYIIILLSKNGSFDYLSLLQSLVLGFEAAILVSAAFLLSTRFSELTTIILTTIILFIGHNLTILKKAAIGAFFLLNWLINSIYYIFPNLEKFNFRNTIVYDQIPSASQILLPILYSIVFSTLLLWLTNISIKKQTT